MSTTLVPFDFAGQEIRVVTDEQGEPWFVVADIARVLGYRDAANAARLVEDDERGYSDVSTPGGSQRAITVNESGVYALVFRSSHPQAVEFRRFVTGTVLPQIRRTGSYVAPMTDAEKALVLAREVLSLHETVAELTPRAEVADKLLNADGDLSVGDAAKALTRAGVKTGAGRLFALLASMKWIYRDKGDGKWRVYQTALEGGWMSVLPQSHYHPKTGVLILDPPQPRVTPKGLKRLLADHGADVATSIEILDSFPAVTA